MDNKRVLILENGWSNDITRVVLDNTDWDIEYAFVSTQKESEEFACERRVKNIYVLQDAATWLENDTTNLSYEEIERHKYLEADFCDGTVRYINDYNLVKVLFYNSLAFWLKIFDEHSLDVVIVQEVTHGHFTDLIPIALAKEREIPCYQIEPMMYQKMGIYLNNVDEYIQLSGESGSKLGDAMYYDLDSKNEFINSPSICKHIIKKVSFKFGGAMLAKSLVTIWQKHSIYDYIFNLSYTKHTLIDKWLSYLIFKNAQKYMRKNASDVSLNENYVVYYLHFEPEASILVSCPIKTQLLAIQMLAENLPDGWKLYVKEHPHQGRVNENIFWDFLNTIGDYKTKKFYDYIAKLPNTYIINPDISSAELTAHAMAISTYHGTVAIESLKSHKPVLLFAGNKSVLKYTNVVFNIKSSSECKEALLRIAEGYQPNDEDYDAITAQYLAPANAFGTNLIVKSIYKDFEHNFHSK